RGRRQPGVQESPQPLDRRGVSAGAARLARARCRAQGQLVAALVEMAGGAWRRQAQSAGAYREQQIQAARSGAGPLCAASRGSLEVHQGATMEEIYIVGAARTPIGKFGDRKSTRLNSSHSQRS